MDDIKRKMDGAINSLKHNFTGLRTGRASPALVENLKVEVYGSEMPLNQIGSISTPEARTIAINVWDKGSVASVDKAIRASGLGLNPTVDGQNIRIHLPPLTEERRKELTKVASKAAEDSKVAIRNVRRDGMDAIKKVEKTISEDEARGLEDKVQKLTDEHIKLVDSELEKKTKEIMTV
jgi:ribosome recycling factor